MNQSREGPTIILITGTKSLSFIFVPFLLPFLWSCYFYPLTMACSFVLFKNHTIMNFYNWLTTLNFLLLSSLYYSKLNISWSPVSEASAWTLENCHDSKTSKHNWQKKLREAGLPLPSSSSGWAGLLPSTAAATSGAEMRNSIFLGPVAWGCSNTSEGCRAGALRTTKTITATLNCNL